MRSFYAVYDFAAVVYVLAACVVCDNHTAAEDLVLADTPESLAILGEILTNTSSVVGGSAQFYCEVIGTQALGETLRFAKVRKYISQMIPLNLWMKQAAQLIYIYIYKS